MKLLKIFKLDCFKLKLFALLFFTSFNLQAVRYNIEFREVAGATRSFVRPSGEVYQKYINDLIESSNAHGNARTWEKFAGELESNDQKGKIGEIAALIYFESLGYEPVHCKVKTSGNKGIDAIFVKSDEVENPSHMIINEAKFSQDNFNLGMFDHYDVNGDQVQQSHSKWNEDRFRAANISCVNYDAAKIRTATYLNSEGTLQLYEIKDVGGDYPSDFRRGSIIRNAWDELLGR